MSKKSSSQSKLLYNSQAQKLFLPYLKLSDLLSTSSLSKQWQYHLKRYIKQYIIPQLSIDIERDLINQDTLHLIKTLLHRKLIIYQHNTNKQIQFHQICTEVEVGYFVASIQTLQGNTYIALIDKLSTMTKADWNNPSMVYKMPKLFIKSKIIANYLYLINDNKLTRYTSTKQIILNDELILNFNAKIQQFIVSISSALVLVTTKLIASQYIFFYHKQPKFVNIQINVQINNPYNDIILDYGQHGFIISKDGVVYQMNLQQKSIKLQQMKILKNKLITKIIHGTKHYFAYEKKKKSISNWTNNDVLQWAQQQGFQQYLKILKAQKVTGQKLLTMNKTYMQDVLGMTTSLIQQKISLSIQQQNKNSDTFQDYTVYLWGKNDKGQLCRNPSGNVNNALKLKLMENTEIFSCFADKTLLRNTKTQQITMNTLDEQGKLQFNFLTNCKVWSLSGTKQTILYCQQFSPKPSQKHPSPTTLSTKKQKLRTAKNIMDQIQWDTSLNKQQFSIGYNTRYQGILQCQFQQFLNSDVKEFNILYFKQNGNLVWDKKTRLDIL